MNFINKFPSYIERERIGTLRKFSRLYDGEHFGVLGLHEIIKKQYKDVKDLVYLSHNLPAYISDFYGDFVAGDVDKLIIRGNTGNSVVDDFVDKVVFENDLLEKVGDFATEQSEFGFVPLLGWKDNENIFHIDQVAEDQYFPQSDGSVIFATYKNISETPDTTKRLVVLIQRYFLQGQDCMIERSAWESDDRGVVTKKYDFKSMAMLVGKPDMPEIEKIEGLNDLPIRQIDNGRKTKWGFGKSDYNDIIPQLAEVNERATHISTTLLKNLDSIMQLPASMANEDGEVEPFSTILMNPEDKIESKYVINTNPLLSDAREHIVSQLKVISLVTAVPMWELLKATQPEQVESMRIQLYAAIRKANRKRAKIKRALNDMFRIGFKIGGIDYADDIEIKFSDVLPVDELKQAETESTKVTAGLSSRLSAVMRLQNLDEDEAQAELDQIKNEDKMAGLDFGTPPKIDNQNQDGQ